ncbi:hypothetical protein BMS3Abin03_01620 [bacterium BMS3Abin03]|nr:hypothetical protein BMS3Abin03_01620 [bacterium BMS3Abin03]
MASIASSTVFPMDGCLAFDKRKLQRASLGTKNTFSALYSSLSSGSAPSYSPSPAFSFSNNSSKASEMYFKNISPSTTCLYSAASIFFLNLSADFQSCFSNGSSVPFFLFFVLSISNSLLIFFTLVVNLYKLLVFFLKIFCGGNVLFYFLFFAFRHFGMLANVSLHALRIAGLYVIFIFVYYVK